MPRDEVQNNDRSRDVLPSYVTRLTARSFVHFQMPLSSAKSPEVDRRSACCRHCARFIAYSIYAWFVPAAVVVGSVFADRLDVNEPLLRAHYAAAGVCWLAGRHGIPLLVGLPLAALTAANFVLYTLALAVAGCDSADGSVRTLRRRAASGLVLTVLLASAWAAALVAVYLKLPPVWYAFIGLQTIIGLFVCLAYAVNRQTFAMLRRNRKQFDVGYEGNGLDVAGQSKDIGVGTNGHCGPQHGLPAPTYDEVISHETSI
jgi:hypothetical protein